MYWFKILSRTGHARNGGKYTYNLPKRGKPGAWTGYISNPVLCQRGYHVTTAEQLREWEGLIAYTRVFVAQIRNRRDTDYQQAKAVCSQIRLLRELRPHSGTWRSTHMAWAKACSAATAAAWLLRPTRKSLNRFERRMKFMNEFIERRMGWRKD